MMSCQKMLLLVVMKEVDTLRILLFNLQDLLVKRIEYSTVFILCFPKLLSSWDLHVFARPK